jgi:putative transposase
LVKIIVSQPTQLGQFSDNILDIHRRHSGLKFVTPEQRHRGEDGPILERRKVLYETAKANNPARWSRSTRDWTPAAEVWLNPHKSTHPPTANQSQVA